MMQTEVSKSAKKVYKTLKLMCGQSNRCKLIHSVIRDNTNLSYNAVCRILSKYNMALWDIDDKEDVITLREDEWGKIN